MGNDLSLQISAKRENRTSSTDKPYYCRAFQTTNALQTAPVLVFLFFSNGLPTALRKLRYLSSITLMLQLDGPKGHSSPAPKNPEPLMHFIKLADQHASSSWQCRPYTHAC